MASARKKWTPKAEISADLLKFREKKKWQIALRRYLVEKQPSSAYAPYFGIDIPNFRSWVQAQFKPGQSWDGFGKTWQLDHIIPVSLFDFEQNNELRLCWNFLNISVLDLSKGKKSVLHFDLGAARIYFERLHDQTGYRPCLHFLKKLDKLDQSLQPDIQGQVDFLNSHKDYLVQISHFSFFEFGLLNSGRTLEEVLKEASFLRKDGQKPN